MKEFIDEIITAPLFAGIKQEDMSAVLTCLRSFERSFDKGKYIFMEQDKVAWNSIKYRG